MSDRRRACAATWFAATCFVALPLGAAEPPLDPTAKAFFAKHCLECHGADAQEAGLTLHKLTGDLTTRPLVQKWTLLYDRIAAGEMPPADSPRPAAAELKAFLDSIGPKLTAADREEALQRLADPNPERDPEPTPKYYRPNAAKR